MHFTVTHQDKIFINQIIVTMWHDLNIITMPKQLGKISFQTQHISHNKRTLQNIMHPKLIYMYIQRFTTTMTNTNYIYLYFSTIMHIQ